MRGRYRGLMLLRCVESHSCSAAVCAAQANERGRAERQPLPAGRLHQPLLHAPQRQRREVRLAPPTAVRPTDAAGQARWPGGYRRRARSKTGE